MKQRPILFSTPMVRALLNGSKTQTRRVFKAKNGGVWPNPNDIPGMRQILRNCPYGQPGDQLWVRETYSGPDWMNGIPPRNWIPGTPIWYWVDGRIPTHGDWTKPKPGMHMPRWASRITLEITGVRVERLQDISEADADAECFGGDFPSNVLPELFPGNADDWGHLSMAQCYQRLWESINGPESWSANPWVWVVEFKRITGGNTP